MKLTSVIKTICFPGIGCFDANSQASLSALFTESNMSFSFDVIIIGTSALSVIIIIVVICNQTVDFPEIQKET